MASVSLDIMLWWSRNYPAWSARREKYANGEQSLILQAWWAGIKFTVGDHS